MSRLDELRHVAGLVGIGTRYVDALGVVREPDEETLSRLIATFGLSDDPALAAAALAEEAAAAPFGLAPVQIVPQEAADPVWALRLPSGVAQVEWQCHFEDGTEATGHGATGHSDGAALHLPPGMPLGYHRLHVETPALAAEFGLIVAPSWCHLPTALQPSERSWGVTTQLYSLRGAHDWGIGDFTDLGLLCRHAGPLGATTIGINPLHALFAAEPRHFSPYSPSSRVWLDYLYIDVTAAPGFAEDAAIQALAPAEGIAAARQAELVDYPAVAALKRPVLEALFRRFLAHDLQSGTKLAADFREFQRRGGRPLAAFAVFEAVQESVLWAGGPFSWHRWPEAMRDPNSAEIAAFAAQHAQRVEFFQFLQWLADRQLGAAAAAGRASGLAIGLYRDLAVGVNPNGAEAWADQDLVLPDAAIGAPPDALSRAGQNWGLAPINPLALRRRGFAPFIAALRANMRHAGILRIDHVMSLQRLYWVPSGCPATAGAYVNYPFHDLLRLVALESRRQGCAVIGEDLGTVPDGFRQTMEAANVLSYRIFMFERWTDGTFIPPVEYPEVAAASAATHDLATLKGFWLGEDIVWRQRLNLYPSPEAEAADIAERGRDRELLLQALAREGLLLPESFADFLSAAGEATYRLELGEAILAYLARSRSRLMLVQIEDIAGERQQANLPGTTDEHPNWRRRLHQPLDDLLAGAAFARVAALIAAARQQAAAHAWHG